MVPDAQEWIRRAYEAWLRAWKGVPEGGKWHLWVGFERPPGVVADTWGKQLCSHQAGQAGGPNLQHDRFQSDLISIVVKSRTKNSSQTWLSDPADPEILKAIAEEADGPSEDNYWIQEYRRPYSEKRALVFDNHGACFRLTEHAERNYDYRESARFYQRTSGGKTFELFQRLSNLPSNPFGFSFFVYNLVESCLAVVAVVDERLAADLLFTSSSTPGERRGAADVDISYFKEQIAGHQKAGVFPIFQLRSRQDGRDHMAHYSLKHGQALRKILGHEKDEDEGEGIRLRSDPSSRCMLKIFVPTFREEAAWNGWPDDTPPAGAAESERAPSIDFLIVHEGAVDMFRTNNRIKWNSDVTMTLFDIAPSVVRTSGRGHHSRNLGERVPFVEASALTAALITSRNKYELSRALLGSVAEKGGVAGAGSYV